MPAVFSVRSQSLRMALILKTDGTEENANNRKKSLSEKNNEKICPPQLKKWEMLKGERADRQKRIKTMKKQRK